MYALALLLLTTTLRSQTPVPTVTSVCETAPPVLSRTTEEICLDCWGVH